MSGYMVPKKIQFCEEKLTFFSIQVQMQLMKHKHDQVHMLLVLFQIIRPNHHIIYVDMAKLADISTEGRCHSVLMDRRCIFQTHWHNNPFIKAKRGSHSS